MYDQRVRLRLFSILTSVAGSLILAGCASKPSAPPPSSSASTETEVWSQNGWSDAERADYHHLAALKW